MERSPQAIRVGVVAVGADGGRWGIGQYLKQLLRAFSRGHPNLEFDVYVVGSETSVFTPDVPEMRPVRVPEALRHPWLNFLWFQVRLPWLCRRDRLDVLFLPAANRRIPIWAPCPMVGMVHDLATLHLPHKYSPFHRLYYNYLIPTLIRRLKCVVTPSEHTRKDVVEGCGLSETAVRVIPHGRTFDRCDSRDPQSCRDRVRRNLGISGPYILYVSRIEHPAKNHMGLIRAFEQVKTTHQVPHQLVLVGSKRERSDEVLAYASKSFFSGSIKFTGFVSGENLSELYCGADLFVHPSLFEGFGLPVLEAMSHGVPIVCASGSSLPEVAGDAAVFFDPGDARQMAACIGRLLTNREEREKLAREGLRRSAQFNWPQTAAATLEILREVGQAHRVSCLCGVA